MTQPVMKFKIWKLPFKYLDRKRKMKEHYDLHEMIKLIVVGDYSDPEVARFKDKEGQLINRHNEQINGLFDCGFNHKSSLDFGSKQINEEPYTYTPEEMEYEIEILKKRQGVVQM